MDGWLTGAHFPGTPHSVAEGGGAGARAALQLLATRTITAVDSRIPVTNAAMANMPPGVTSTLALIEKGRVLTFRMAVWGEAEEGTGAP